MRSEGERDVGCGPKLRCSEEALMEGAVKVLEERDRVVVEVAPKIEGEKRY